jgi:hypothetical protein
MDFLAALGGYSTSLGYIVPSFLFVLTIVVFVRS